jgi:hypothetical protein
MRSIKWCIAGLGCGLAVVMAPRVSLAEAQSRAICVNPARLDVRIPQQHPYLALIPVDVVRAKVYLQKDPGLRIRVVGQTPIAAKVYELEGLRCNLCGEIYEADAPKGLGEKKYDASAAAMIALLK